MIPEEIQKFLQDVPADIEKEKILKLPISHIKDIPQETQKTLENTLSVKTIADFAGKVLTSSNIHLLKLLNIEESALDRWQTIANYILNLIRGTAELDLTMKILLAGLDNAGKTAILNIITKRFNITNLKPTIKVETAQMEAENVTFVIWDMGGQERYRKEYISHPERFFVNVQSVIYVIDVQDDTNYKLSKEYLSQILDILDSFKEYPDFYIFLHKADPKIYDQIQDKLKECDDIVQKIFEDRPFQYHTFHSSIYNTVLTGKNFTQSLGHLFDLKDRKETSSDLVESLELIYNNFINLSYLVENLETRVTQLETQNQRLQSMVSEGDLKKIPTKLPLKPMEKPALPPRQALVQELKQLFRKRG